MPCPRYIVLVHLYTTQFEPGDRVFGVDRYCLLQGLQCLVPLVLFLLLVRLLQDFPCGIWSGRAGGTDGQTFRVVQPMQFKFAEISAFEVRNFAVQYNNFRSKSWEHSLQFTIPQIMRFVILLFSTTISEANPGST